MTKPCGHKNTLQLQGLTRVSKELNALNPNSIPFDERDVEDFLVFWKKMSQRINYYKGQDKNPYGNWLPQLENDPSFLLATYSTEPAKKYLEHYTQTVNSLKSQGGDAQNWAYLFDLVFNAIETINELYTKLPANNPLRNWIFKRSYAMQSTLAKWLAYFKASEQKSLFDFEYKITTPKTPWLNFNALQNLALSGMWYNGTINLTLTDFYNSITPDEKPFIGILTQPNPGDTNLYISLGAHHVGLVETGKMLLQFFASTILQAKKEFKNSLLESNHQPHIALMLAFLQISEPLKAEMNKLTDRHFTHFLSKVLTLTPNLPEMDQVFLTAELTKGIEKYLLPKSAAFNGGKDIEDNSLVYENTQDVVLNLAEVVEIKSLLKTGNKIYKGLDARTENGEGKKQIEIEDGWNPFGSNENNEPEMGFALSSPYFYLAEGNRFIDITLECNQNIQDITNISSKVKAFYTDEKGWQECTLTKQSKIEDHKLVLALSIAANKPPVFQYNPEVHLKNFNSKQPVLAFFLETSLALATQNATLKNLHFTVGTDKVEALSVQNKSGTLDASKTFKPLGGQPKKGDYFVIGSPEVFSKDLQTAKVNLTWAGNESSDTLPSFKIYARYNKAWTQIKASHSNTQNLSINATTSYSATPINFTNKEIGGFLKFEMSNKLGFEDFIERFTKTAIKLAQDCEETDDLPTPPYVPEIGSIYMSYTSKVQKIALGTIQDPKENNFFHITPFGEYSALGSKTGVEYPTILWPINKEGQCFFGFQNLNPEESVSTLIKVVEGSSNPLKTKQEVVWQYLEKNQWKNFEADVLSDGSNGLIQSGLLQFAVPKEFTQSGAALGNQLFWVRASAEANIDAICKISLVKTQAFLAQLIRGNYSQEHLTNQLPAKSIAKSVAVIPSLKKVNQPFNSFGGKPIETTHAFRIRASERMRHKNRAITMQDYEQLVLQNFREISVAKCLNHTQYSQEGLDVHYTEGAPGHVSIITIPEATNQSLEQNKRFTPLDLLEKIKTELKLHTSDFVTLHVKNPTYVEIKITCDVAYRPEFSNTSFYKKELIKALTQYLSPWSLMGQKQLFNSVIYKSNIIDFLDELPYVDYLKNVNMDIVGDENLTDKQSKNVEKATASNQSIMFVSSQNHIINTI